MKIRFFLPVVFAAGVTTAPAAATLTAMTSFGDGDGWLSPGDSATDFVNPTGNTERGLAYNPATGHLLLVSRAGGLNVRILDSASGEDLGGLTMTGGVTISGGIFAINQVRADNDGVIYVSNLASPVNGTTPFKIYRWENETAASTPTLAFTSTTITAGRLGDNLDTRGGGATAVLIAGESTATGSSGLQNGYIVFNPSGIALSGTKIDFATPPPNAGDFNRGIAFMDSDTAVIGKGSPGFSRRTTYSGSTGTLVGTQTVAGFMMDYAVVGGVPLLATLDLSNSTGTNTVRIYDMTNPAAPVLDATANLTTSFTSSAGAVGSITFGAITGNTATLYALNVANGIQAFNVTVDPPMEFTTINLNAGVLNLEWASSPTRTYRLEAATDLVDWTPVASSIPADADATTDFAWTVTAPFLSRAQVRVVRE